MLIPDSDPLFLRQQLESLLEQAWLNEAKMRRFDQLERLLIGASSLGELIQLLLTEYKQAFAVDTVSLALVDSHGQTAQVLAQEHGDHSSFPGLTLVNTPRDLPFTDETQPRLEAFEATRHGPLFGQEFPPASVALLPLVRHGQLIGGLYFGSRDPERYHNAFGTDFLSRLAAIVAVCVESALIRAQLKQAGLTDALTGIHNRRYFDHRNQVEISQARRHGTPLACMLLDIDHFKRINDTHGHPAGDAVLREIAQCIQHQLRTGDVLARYGGEEFIVLLPHTASHHALEIAERIRQKIAACRVEIATGTGLQVTASIGLSALEAGHDRQLPDEAELLVSQADQALYRAKSGGRNRVISHHPSAPAQALHWSNIFQHCLSQSWKMFRQLPKAFGY